jgi:predicted dehydrogenase
MGGGKWRTERAYNPCAGGLSHNFMTALSFVGSPIVRVRATGQVFTYHENLDKLGGYDTMEGTIEFANGRRINWTVCLAMQGPDTPFGHRTVAHTFQFARGSLVYGSKPRCDELIVDGRARAIQIEPSADQWGSYNHALYKMMHADILDSIATGVRPLHNIAEGINVAYACRLAFESAKQDGKWIEVPGR